jgi:SAM-dependent methyltransferase
MEIHRIVKSRNKAVEKLTSLEQKIYNDGERLIPGVTHDIHEVIRHTSSYLFFKKIIERDLASKSISTPISIVDLGCGVGHGCFTLSRVNKSLVTGVDTSEESLEYAKSNYSKANIHYQKADLIKYVATMPEFDYVTSRGVLEHVPDGIRLARSAKWRRRLMFDVPYDEASSANPYHLLTRIREENFSEFPEAELFYEGLDGVIYDKSTKPPRPNMIMCICSHPDLPKVSKIISFPVSAWHPKSDFYTKPFSRFKNAVKYCLRI